jgi:phosphatidylglycerophosphate synthase
LARRAVAPLKDSWITPNCLTSVRLAVGLVAAAAFIPGAYGWSNLGAILLVLSNFLDHADGELARLSGKGSRIGHLYDLASDAIVTIALFVAIGLGVGAQPDGWPAGMSVARHALAGHALAAHLLAIPPALLGLAAGGAIAAIFYLRMRIEEIAGKAASRQASWAGLETEDVLYLLPLVTLCNGLAPFLLAAAIGAPLFLIGVAIHFRRVLRRSRPLAQASTPGVA